MFNGLLHQQHGYLAVSHHPLGNEGAAGAGFGWACSGSRIAITATATAATAVPPSMPILNLFVMGDSVGYSFGYLPPAGAGAFGMILTLS